MAMHRMPQFHTLGEIILTRQPVRSSNLKAIGYSAATQTLEVEFLDGHVYSYAGVPLAVHAGLMSASSHGTYLDAQVKKGGYRYTKLN
jgi:KTSC domain